MVLSWLPFCQSNLKKGEENDMKVAKNNEIRDMPAEKIRPQLTLKSGRTTFLIGIHFPEKGKETLDDKVKRLISKDVEAGNF